MVYDELHALCSSRKGVETRVMATHLIVSVIAVEPVDLSILPDTLPCKRSCTCLPEQAMEVSLTTWDCYKLSKRAVRLFVSVPWWKAPQLTLQIVRPCITNPWQQIFRAASVHSLKLWASIPYTSLTPSLLKAAPVLSEVLRSRPVEDGKEKHPSLQVIC